MTRPPPRCPVCCAGARVTRSVERTFVRPAGRPTRYLRRPENSAPSSRANVIGRRIPRVERNQCAVPGSGTLGRRKKDELDATTPAAAARPIPKLQSAAHLAPVSTRTLARGAPRPGHLPARWEGTGRRPARNSRQFAASGSWSASFIVRWGAPPGQLAPTRLTAGLVRPRLTAAAPTLLSTQGRLCDVAQDSTRI